jgi:hypothetical protein
VIHERERELRAITDKLVEAQPGSLDDKLKDIRRFEAVGEWDLFGGYPSTKSSGAGGRRCTISPSYSF